MDHYHGKIIIFGEYTVIDNGCALALPLKSVYGSLNIGIENDLTSNMSILRFCQYLERLVLPHNVTLNIHQLKDDINKGLYLDTNARAGYGIGSSGILTAAIFLQYYNGMKLLSINELKEILASMESFFHGNSSGIDPLVSLINSPVRTSNDHIAIIDHIPETIMKNFYLLDTGISRTTQLLVEWYKNSFNKPAFKKAMKAYSETINPIIDDLLSGQIHPFEENLKAISSFQLKWWKPLIPKAFLEMWTEGLEKDNYYTKICGAGGGGYLLVYKKDCLPDLNYDISTIV